MEVNITELAASREKFRFLNDRKMKIHLLGEILDSSVDDFFSPLTDRIEDGNSFLMLRESHLESIILYTNSYFDIVVDIVELETPLRIRRRGRLIDDYSYQMLLSQECDLGRKVVELRNLHESQFFRHAANLLKHDALINASLTIGSGGSGVFLKPFRTATFESPQPTSHTQILEYSTAIVRKNIDIVSEIIRVKTAP